MRAAPSFRAEPTTPGTLPPVPSSRGSSSQSVSRGGSRGSGRRTVGPGGFGRQYDVFEGANSAPLQQEQEWSEEAAEYYQGTPMDCYLPFKLFRSASTEPAYKPRNVVDRGGSMSAMSMAHDPTEVNQMDQFVSETAQAMVGFHCQKCMPVRAPGQKMDLFKMETLSDLMKKHKDAFHREYQEFGPVSEWNPDATSSALPVPEAARDLGKHFDLRGELATITHVGRARCRLRQKTPPLLFNHRVAPSPVGLRATPSITQAPSFLKSGELTVKKAQAKPMSPKAGGFPSSLQGLFLPSARTGVAIVKDNDCVRVESN